MQSFFSVLLVGGVFYDLASAGWLVIILHLSELFDGFLKNKFHKRFKLGSRSQLLIKISLVWAVGCSLLSLIFNLILKDTEKAHLVSTIGMVGIILGIVFCSTSYINGVAEFQTSTMDETVGVFVYERARLLRLLIAAPIVIAIAGISMLLALSTREFEEAKRFPVYNVILFAVSLGAAMELVFYFCHINLSFGSRIKINRNMLRRKVVQPG